MTRTFTWAAGSAVIALGLLTGQGCLVNINDGDTGGGASTTSGSNTTSGPDTTTGSSTTTGSYTTTGSGVLPSGCDAKAGDDTCTACEKKSCCAELQACSGDAACADTYGVYSECLFPAGGDASGYTSTYCQAVAGESSPAGKKAADAIISCLTTTCGTDTACGVPEVVTWDNFASEFTENYCAGCHFDGFETITSQGWKIVPDPLLPLFSNDSTWSTWGEGFPKSNPSWKSEMNYESTKAQADKIWCGVSTQLPDECEAKFPGHFPKAERFPPLGTDPNKAQCGWVADGACPHPSDVERNKMSSWVFDGTPK